jgi:epoxyqueuosine reductase
MDERDELRDLAAELGFDLFGVAPLRPPRDAQRFEQWLAAGRHGELDYLERHRERIVDPRRGAPRGRSLLIVGLGHSRPATDALGGGRVARYAAGRDYHNVLTRMLRKLRRRLVERGWLAPDALARPMTDATPLLERSHAAEAGVGFLSKAANLLHARFGPWFFVGELVIEREVEPTTEPAPGSCGTCTACIDACPTGAIAMPGVVDARDCISYHTIENRGSVPRELRPHLGTWAFGCDVCSEVCPWGARAPNLAQRFGVHRALESAGIERWIALREPERWKEHFEGSPLQRARREGLARNAAIVLGNAPRAGAERVLLEALSFDPSPIVRESAAWSLARAYGARAAVERAARLEVDASVRAAMLADLDTEPAPVSNRRQDVELRPPL